jgi:DnaJ-class molecular chaperone
VLLAWRGAAAGHAAWPHESSPPPTSPPLGSLLAPHPPFNAAAKVPLITALCGGDVHVDTLDGRRLTVALPSPMSAHATKTLAGEGMPISKEPGKKGNMVVAIEPVFPRSLTQQQKDALRQALPATL